MLLWAKILKNNKEQVKEVNAMLNPLSLNYSK